MGIEDQQIPEVVAEPTPGPVNYQSGVASPVPLPQQVAQQRAYKAKLGLDDWMQSYDDIVQGLMSGQEETLRRAAAAYKDTQIETSKQTVLYNLGKRWGNQPFNPEDEDFVRKVIDIKASTDPKSVFEKYYSQKFMDRLRTIGMIDPDSNYRDQPANDEQQLIDSATNLQTWNEVVRTTLEDGREEYKHQSTIGWLADRGKEALIPGYWQFKMWGLSAGSDAQALEYLRLPLEERITKFKGDFKRFYSDNPGLALDWAEGLLGTSSSQNFTNAALRLLDLTIVPGLVRPAIKGVQGLRAVAQGRGAAASAISSIEKEPRITSAAIAEATGDIKTAGIKEGTDKVAADIKGSKLIQMNELESMPSAMNGTIAQLKTERPLRTELVNRILDRYEYIKGAVLDRVANSIKVERLPGVFAVEQQVKAIAEEVKSWPGLRNSVLDVGFEQSKLGNWYAAIKLGEGPELFKNERTAKAFAKEKGLIGAEVSEDTQKGIGWYVKVLKPINEKESYIRDWLATTTEAKTPDDWLNAFTGHFGKFRSAEDVLSMTNRLNRTTAAYAPQQFDKLIKENWAEVAKLRSRVPGTEKRKKWLEWHRVIDDARSRVGTGEKDEMFSSISELENMYTNILHRLPDDQEIAAAYAYKRQTELVELFRNLQFYKNRVAEGAETHTISLKDLSRETKTIIPFKQIVVDGTDVKSKWPKGDAIVAVFGNQLGVENTIRLASNSNVKKMLEEEIIRGSSKLIRLSDPNDFPLKGIGKITNERVEYIVVRSGTVKSEQLRWRTLPIRKLDTEYEHYIRQAKIHTDSLGGMNHYLGDTTVAAFSIRSMGIDVASKLDKLRLFFKDGNEAGAKAFYDANPLGISYSKIKDWFSGTDPRLSLQEPIQLVPRNKMVIQVDKALPERFKQGKFKNSASTYSGKYDTEDLFTLNDTGTKGNPVYGIAPIKYVDPITSVNRSINRAVNSLYLEDYKVASVAEWMKEAERYLAISREQLKAAPEYWFWNAEKWVDGNEQKVSQLKLARLQIKQFLGVNSRDTTFLHSFGQRMVDMVYEKAGPGFTYVPLWLLPKLKDPFSVMRSLTFHEKLGLFNIPQLWVQLNTYATILGVSGFRFAAPGTKAALLHTYSRFNRSPEMMELLDKYASTALLPGTHHYKPGWFKEAHELLTNSGFEVVANEYAVRADVGNKQLMQSTMGTILDAGKFFFTEGERASRLGAYYTAFLEHRTANPLGALGQDAQRAILKRADLLYVNMSRASNNLLQQGVFSIPFQFFTYNLRLAELFLGKRLTGAERIRLFGTYGALYGVPVALGLTGLPMGDMVRKWALENGYVVGDDYLRTAIGEGLPSLLTGLMTGNYYNIGERYGASGIQLAKDAMRSDRTWWQVIGGAATTSLINQIESLDGFTSWIGSAWRGDGQYKFKIEDAFAPLKELSSVNQLWGLIASYNTGIEYSKKELALSKTDSMNAWTKFMFGLQRQQVSDIYKKIWTMQDEKAMHSYAQGRFITDLRRGFYSAKNGDKEQSVDYGRRAFNWLRTTGFPREDYAKAIALAAKDHETLINHIDWEFAQRKVPGPRKPTAIEQFGKIFRGRQ